MKEWYEVTLSEEEALMLENSEFYLGCIENENGTRTLYFEKTENSAKILTGLNLKTIDQNSWKELWREYFVPIQTGGFTIVPPWISGDGDIIINPGLGFGTGHHETTSLAASVIRKIIENNKIASFLDVGTGSGILSIIAAKSNRELRIVAIDIDDDAVQNSRENIEMNKIENIDLMTTSIETLSETFDIVVANIISSVLLSIAENLKSKAEKYLVLSGILIKEKDDFIEKMEISDFEISEFYEKGEWCAFVLKRK